LNSFPPGLKLPFPSPLGCGVLRKGIGIQANDEESGSHRSQASHLVWSPVRTAPSGLFAGQVFVFHFPGVVERVIRGVPDQVAERPGARHIALGMQRPNRAAIGFAVRD